MTHQSQESHQTQLAHRTHQIHQTYFSLSKATRPTRKTHHTHQDLSGPNTQLKYWNSPLSIIEFVKFRNKDHCQHQTIRQKPIIQCPRFCFCLFLAIRIFSLQIFQNRHWDFFSVTKFSKTKSLRKSEIGKSLETKMLHSGFPNV